jgi:hypothetical protein
MATRVHYKSWSLIFVLFAFLAFVFLAIRRPPPATASAVAMKFVGYTNLPNNDLRFALFSISNQARYAVHWRGDWVEVEGNQNHKGRTVNPSLPGYTYAPVLKMGESVEFAVGEPFHATASGRWRFSMSFTRYSVQERWFDFSWRHKLPTQIGPLVLVDSQRILNPSNHVTVSTEWLTK